MLFEGSDMRDESRRRQSTVLLRVPTSFILDLNPSTCDPSSPSPTRTPWGAPPQAERVTAFESAGWRGTKSSHVKKERWQKDVFDVQ